MALQRPELSDPAHEERGLQPQRDGRGRRSTLLGINSVSFLLFPSSPGIVKAQWRTNGANPCQNRQGRFREQHSGKNGIDDPPDKVDVPGNLALFVQSYVGLRCH